LMLSLHSVEFITHRLWLIIDSGAVYLVNINNHLSFS
jgi:hypothetical protein